MFSKWMNRCSRIGVVGLACFAACFLMARAYGRTSKQPAAVTSAMQIPAVRRYVEWRGGPAFEALRSMHMSGHVVDGGLEGTKELWETSRGIYWEREKTGAIVTAIAVSKHGDWRTNLSGQPIMLSSNEVRRYRRESVLLFAGIFRGDLGASVVALSDETFDGSLWNVFRVTFGDADSYDFFVAPDSGKLGTLRATVDRRASFTVYS